MKEIRNSMIIFIDTDFLIKDNYCMFYKELYFYFIIDFDKYGLYKYHSHLFNYVYAVLVISESENIDLWSVATLFLRSLVTYNDHKIRFITNLQYITESENETLLTCLSAQSENAPNDKRGSRNQTEFEKIINTSGYIEYTENSIKKSATKEKLLRLYSVAISDTNILFKILFFINIIAYPYKKDKKEFLNSVKDFLNNKENITTYLKYELKNIIEGYNIFGNLSEKKENYDYNVDNFPYGKYFYENIRSSIVHTVREEKGKDYKKDIEIDNQDQSKLLSSVSIVLKQIAQFKLKHHGILPKNEMDTSCFLKDDECYIIKDKGIQNKIIFVNNYANFLIHIDPLTKKYNENVILGNQKEAKKIKRTMDQLGDITNDMLIQLVTQT